MDGIPEAGIQRLSYYITVRLAELRWSLEDLADAGGPAPATLYKARRQNRELRPRTAARLESALGWPVGSVPRILAGGVPMPGLSARLEATVTDAAAGLGSSVSAARRDSILKEVLLAVASVLDPPPPCQDGQPREAQADAHAS